jgi:hypothetical protein
MTNPHFIQFPIVVSEIETTGIFFRSPFFKRYFDMWDGEEKFSAQVAKECKGFWGFVHFLLNTRKTLDDKIEFSSESDVAGYSLNSIRRPFYFKRVERTLSYASDVVSIEARGFNFLDERVGGHCQKETAVIKVNGKVVFRGRSDKNGGYNLTYSHQVEQKVQTWLDGGVLYFPCI